MVMSVYACLLIPYQPVMADVTIYVIIERNPGPVTVDNGIQTRKSELPRDSPSEQMDKCYFRRELSRFPRPTGNTSLLNSST